MSQGRFLLARLQRASAGELAHRLRELSFVSAVKSANWLGWEGPRVPPEGRPGRLSLPELSAWDDVGERREPVEDPSLRDDIRALWEPARLQALRRQLWEAGRTDGDAGQRARRDAASAAVEWVRSNRSLTGVHYRSAMECGLRIPAFVRLLEEGALEPPEREEVRSALYRHAWWVSNRVSLYSSLGNHTVAESVGLAFAGAVFRGTERGQRWLQKAVRLLTGELDHQILPDGGPAEQSFSYHRFVLDLYWLAADFLERNELFDCTAWKPRLHLGEEFLEALSVGPGEYPGVGDSDDGHAVAPGLRPLRPRAPGVRVETSQSRIGSRRLSCRTFHEAGYSAIRSEDGLFVSFDHGPLGMAPLYNHGHADALSIFVAVGGVALLVDPGTYRYNGVPQWRRYFKSTRAHSTVCIDGEDQAIQETGFIWSRPFRSTLELADERQGGLRLAASHDGYRRLSAPVTHRRVLEVDDGDSILVEDLFEGEGLHRYELCFHVHPDAQVSPQGDGWRLRREGAELLLRPQEGPALEAVRGSTEPLLGWYSGRYGQKEPSVTLHSEQSGKPGAVRFRTEIRSPASRRRGGT